MSEDQHHSGSTGANSRSAPEEPKSAPGGAKSSTQGGQRSSSALHVPGSRVGRYRLLAPLASGGMAQVWAAKPEGPGFARTVALKLIRGEYASDDEYARMFIDEATVAASIHHPNVCETYELGRDEGMLFMAIEWVAGDSLAGLLHRNSGLVPIGEALAARIVADACAGLHAAHDAVGVDGTALGVVHRDVSPPNILLSLHGQVKVSDFGIAKAKHQIHSRTRTGEIKGKFAYIAPEQIGAKGVDRRADIFSLGCILYVATLGLRPFGSGPTAMAKILAGEYKRPSSLVDGYPAELESIIVRCLQKSPAARYQTADEMRTELERWLLGLKSPVGPKDLSALVKERLDPSKRTVIETLLRSNQFLPDAMVYQLVKGEVEQTPTATSSVMFGPMSNPSAAVDWRESVGRHARQKPLVRFTALGRPIAADSGTMPAGAPFERTDTEATDEPTSTNEPRDYFSSSPPRLGAAAQATVRPPGLQPVRSAARARRRSRRPLGVGLHRNAWLVVVVIVGIVVGWGSCQLIPP